MELGVRDERVRSLRHRLAASGDLPSVSAEPTAFDDAVDAAVRHFQRRHGLTVDGVVGPATLRALNTSLDARIRQVMLNLERWRWLPQDLGSRYVLVNIPAFELDVVEDTTSVLSMRVIVGRDYRRTPVLSSTMTHLVLNPYWYVPPSIVVRDILPRVQADPGYLRAQGMRVFRTRDGRPVEVSPDEIDWAALSAGTLPFQVRQEPGPLNALGAVKLMFPNRFNVYLHDTPARELFARDERSMSAGCIRLERPLELAAYVLRGDSSWTPSSLRESLSTAHDRTIRLPEPIPVHLLYWTAWADDEGLHFRRDLYGRDAPLWAAMQEPPPQP